MSAVCVGYREVVVYLELLLEIYRTRPANNLSLGTVGESENTSDHESHRREGATGIRIMASMVLTRLKASSALLD